jgi:hypothetical protein
MAVTAEISEFVSLTVELGDSNADWLDLLIFLNYKFNSTVVAE